MIDPTRGQEYNPRLELFVQYLKTHDMCIYTTRPSALNFIHRSFLSLSTTTTMAHSTIITMLSLGVLLYLLVPIQCDMRPRKIFGKSLRTSLVPIFPPS